MFPKTEDEGIDDTLRINDQYSEYWKDITALYDQRGVDPFDNIDKLQVLLSRIVLDDKEKAVEGRILDSIDGELRFFCTRLWEFLKMNSALIDGSFDRMWDASNKIISITDYSAETVERGLSNMQLIFSCIQSLFPDNFCDTLIFQNKLETSDEGTEALHEGTEALLWASRLINKKQIHTAKKHSLYLKRKISSLSRYINFTQLIKRATSLEALLQDCPDDQCAICADGALNGDADISLMDSCRHIFCTECLETWLQINRSCPTCRQKVLFTVSDSVVEEYFLEDREEEADGASPLVEDGN